MILVCKKCKSSFLVPASIFSGGPRRVKCARCGESWVADAVTKTKHEHAAPKKAEEKPALEPQSPNESLPPPPDAIIQPPPEKLSTGKLVKLLMIGSGIVVGILLFLAILFVSLHDQVVQLWPPAHHIYVALNLVKETQASHFALRKVRSIRRYQDGGMHLIVEGEIVNQGEKVQLVPTLTVDALGVDGKLIESWRIEPSQATLKTGEAAAFSSAILSPQETVAEVNLRFVELPHDDE